MKASTPINVVVWFEIEKEDIFLTQLVMVQNQVVTEYSRTKTSLLIYINIHNNINNQTQSY